MLFFLKRVQINELDPHVVSYGLVSLISGAVIRILTTIAIAFGDKLNWKEKVSDNVQFVESISSLIYSFQRFLLLCHGWQRLQFKQL